MRTRWDPFKLFGYKIPTGSTWSLLGDYFSARGPGIGLTGRYQGSNLFDIPGQYKGEVIGYYLHDQGTDDLVPTAGRSSLPTITAAASKFAISRPCPTGSP